MKATSKITASQDGQVSVKQADAELGIPADVVYNWLAHGQVAARRGPSGRWCIPWDPDTQAIYRRKVTASFDSNPTRRPGAIKTEHPMLEHNSRDSHVEGRRDDAPDRHHTADRKR